MKGKLAVENLYNVAGVGPILVGHVRDGYVRLGMKLNINDLVMEIKSMRMEENQIDEGEVGDFVRISFVKADIVLLNQFKGREVVFTEDGGYVDHVGEANQPKKTFFQKLFGK